MNPIRWCQESNKGGGCDTPDRSTREALPGFQASVRRIRTFSVGTLLDPQCWMQAHSLLNVGSRVRNESCSSSRVHNAPLRVRLGSISRSGDQSRGHLHRREGWGVSSRRPPAQPAGQRGSRCSRLQFHRRRPRVVGHPSHSALRALRPVPWPHPAWLGLTSLACSR